MPVEPVECRSMIKFLVLKTTPPSDIVAEFQEVYHENKKE